MKPAIKTNSRKKPKPVSELESHLGFWLRFVSNHVSARFRRKVEATGISVSEWVALRQLYNVNASSPAELMDALGMTKGAISKIVSRLEEKGLVERAMVDTDRRAQQVTLTALGRARIPVLASLADENDEAFFGHLSAARREALIVSMKKIVQHHQLKQIPVE